MLSTHNAQASTRVALVIGNADYGKFGRLPTPTNDAQVVAQTLSELGFQIRRRSNLNRRDLKSELTSFLRAARLADVALVYYSGYQLTLNDKTYLTPVSEAPTSVNAAQLAMVSVEALMRRLSDAATQNILILEGGWRSPVVANLGGFLEKGAVKVLRSAPSDLSNIPAVASGKLSVITATSGGRLNPSETGAISVFTKELVKQLSTPGAKLSEMFDLARQNTNLVSNQTLLPAVAGRLSSALYLAGQPLIVPARQDKFKLAQQKWQQIQTTNIIEEIQSFLDEFGDTPIAGVALSRIQSLRAIDPEERKRLRDTTIERRNLLKAYEIEKKRKDVLLADLRGGTVAISPILSPFDISGNVAVRAAPGSSGAWLGLYKAGDVAQVRGKVVGKNWYQVEWRQDEVEGIIYGYFFAKSASPQGDSEYLVWQAISENPNVESLLFYLQSFPKGFYRFEAVREILAQKYPDALTSNSAGSEEFSSKDVDIRGLQLQAGEVPKLAETAALSVPAQTISEPNVGPRTIMIREMGYRLDVMEEEYITTSVANLRRLPWVKTRKIAEVDKDSKIVVTGKVREENWYRVKWGDGRDLYVHGSNVEPFAGSEYELWQESKSTGEISDLNFYLQYYASGRFAEEAKELISKIRSQQNLTEETVLAPAAPVSVDLPSGADEFVNIRPIVYNGVINQSMSASLMHKFGSTLKTRVSNLRQSKDNTMLDISGRIIEVKVEDTKRSTFLAFGRLLGDSQQNTPNEKDQLLSYHVVVELSAKVQGENDPIISITEQLSDIGPETAQPLAVQITMKKAFDKAANDILQKLGSVF